MLKVLLCGRASCSRVCGILRAAEWRRQPATKREVQAGAAGWAASALGPEYSAQPERPEWQEQFCSAKGFRKTCRVLCLDQPELVTPRPDGGACRQPDPRSSQRYLGPSQQATALSPGTPRRFPLAPVPSGSWGPVCGSRRRKWRQ